MPHEDAPRVKTVGNNPSGGLFLVTGPALIAPSFRNPQVQTRSPCVIAAPCSNSKMREEVIELFDHFKGFSDAECVIVWQALTIGGDHRPRNPGGNLALHEGSREHWQGRH
jgi:hypothetical protein